MIEWAWIADHVGAIAGRLAQHIELTAIALAVGFAISLVLAIASVRVRRVRPFVIGVAGVVFTIPSLALFSALVPIIGLSLLTVEVPLVLYTLVIYVRNIVAGLESVPPDVIEAADAMGYTRNGRLARVELPLAVPLMIAGLRLASVSTIGLVTISGILGDSFGGLGFFIFERPTFATEILVGAAGSIGLAIAVDILLGRLQQRLTPWSRLDVALDVATSGRSAAQRVPEI
ncbi:MAG: ABC transporter permease [Chloroflexi bacterium]|nr:ABC transporter permease [Chloroflexota bacterium]